MIEISRLLASFHSQTVEKAPFRNIISFEPKFLSVGSGFFILTAIVVFFAILLNRKRRNLSDFSTPLIQHFNLSSLKANGNLANEKVRSFPITPLTRHYYRSPGQSPSNESMQSSHGSNSSSGLSQCTPPTPYSSFSVNMANFEQQLASFSPTNAANTYKIEQQKRLKNASGESARSPTPPFVASEKRGSISIQLLYDQTSLSLQVTILACHDLPELISSSADKQCALDPYVKLRILPDNQHRVKTRILRSTKNPFYDETFTMYGLNESNIKNYSLYLAVLAFDRYSHDLILGETTYSLAELDLTNNNQKLSTTLKLKARENLGKMRGNVQLSMAYHPHSKSINFAVLKMNNLPKDNLIGLMDPYAKVYMLVNGKRVAKQKTHVKKKTRDPIFNESFNFDIKDISDIATAKSPLAIISFLVLIMNHDGVTRNELIGQCKIDAHTPQYVQVCAEASQQFSEWYSIQP